MDNIFIVNPSVSSADIRDAIHNRLTKTQAITASLLTNHGGSAELPSRFIYGSVWAVDEYLGELEQLFEILNKRTMPNS